MPANQTTERLDRLTPKERACLVLVARRMSSKEIAAELGIAKTSVDTYCNRARSKLGVSNRYEAARLLVTQTRPQERAEIAVATPEPSGPSATASAPTPTVSAKWPAKIRLVVAVAAVLVAVLAMGSLMSGLSALQEMRK